MTQVKKFTWAHYSPKLKSKILNQRFCDIIEEAPQGFRLVQSEEGSREEGAYAKLYLLVNLIDGEIKEAKYLAFGESGLIGALEVMCELMDKKNYDQARRISADLIDKHVQSVKEKSSFPIESYSHINFALGLLESAINQCIDIPLADGYVSTPVNLDDMEDGEYPDWAALSTDERISTIRAVIVHDIQPYIELDDGGVTITELKDDINVVIQYSGSCTSCYAATGSTLSAIQAILRKKVHPEMVVTPLL